MTVCTDCGQARDLTHTVHDDDTYPRCWACVIMVLADAERRGDSLTIFVPAPVEV